MLIFCSIDLTGFIQRIGVINNNRTTNMRVDFLSAKAIFPWKELTSKGYLVKEKKFPML